jgi:hypothetical protein
MSMTVDTLIQNLSTQANAYNSAAYNYTYQATEQVKGDAQSTDSRFVPYIVPSIANQLDTTIPPELYGVPTTQIVDGLRAELELYFNEFFPDISTQYTTWIAEIADAVSTGVPLTLDNETANRQAQVFGEAEGIRIQRKLRAAWAGKGYTLPPGAMVGMVLDESDTRTEQLITGAIGNANKATDQVLSTYKIVLATALATSDARVAAVNAMSALIKTAAAIYSTDVDAKIAILKARAAAADAALAYYSAELKLDSVNTGLYKQNVQLAVQRFEKDGSLFFRNEGAQVESAIAGAVEAGKIAQAAFLSLNTIVSASTAGFA